jgi:ribosome recycling factor
MSDAVDLADLKRRMEGAVSNLKSELNGLRTGRASANLARSDHGRCLWRSDADQSGGNRVSVPEPRMISVQVWDAGLSAAVDKAIRESSLGLNPVSEGQLIRVPIPEVTAERRQELVKVAHKYAESARVAVRHVRRDGLDMVKKAEKADGLGEDESRSVSDQIQKLTDGTVGEIDSVLQTKEKEILQV